MSEINDVYNCSLAATVEEPEVGLPHIKKAYFAEIQLKDQNSVVTEPYTVVRGDSVGRIARRHGTTAQLIREANNLEVTTMLHPDQILLVPSSQVDGQNIELVRLNEARIGAEAYIVVETENFRRKKLRVNIRQGKEEVLTSVDSPIDVEIDGERKQLIEIEVGEYAVESGALNCSDFEDFAILKIGLTAPSAEELQELSAKIMATDLQATPLYLLVDAHSDNEDYALRNFSYYGRNEGTDSKKNLWLDMDGLWFMLSAGRAPWMDIILVEAQAAGGAKEWDSPLKEKVKDTYHKYGARGMNLTHKNAWCASFACWALHEAGYEEPRSPSSRRFQDRSGTYLREVDKPYYGALATWSDCDKDGNIEGTGHVSFVFGKLSDSETTKHYYVLGGNQGDSLKVTKYDCTGNAFKSYRKKVKKTRTLPSGEIEKYTEKVWVYKKFRGFFMPNSYEPGSSDLLTDSDTYDTQDIANTAATNVTIATAAGESSR